MIRKRLTGLSLLMGSLIAGGCFFDSPAGPDKLAGGTIETTNGIVIAPDGRPAARVTGYLLEEDAWLSKIKEGKSVVIDSFVTNDSGRFEMKKDTSKHASLYVKAPLSGILIKNVSRRLIENEYGSKIVLKQHASYHGQVSDTGARAREVYLVGTPFSGTVMESGDFFIEDVPQGTYTVVVRRVGADQTEEFIPGGEVAVLPKQDTVVTPPDTLKPDTTNTLLIEDFEDGDNRTKLGPVLGGGYWDAYSDEYLNGNSRLLQPVNASPMNFAQALDTTAAVGSTSLKVLYQLGDKVGEEKPYPFVFVEANLGVAENSNYVHYNLTEMDTVSFWAKGTGSLGIEFIQNQIGVPLHVTAGASVTLTENWQHFRLATADFGVTVSIFPANPEQFRQQLADSRLPQYSQKPTTWAEMGGMARTIRFLGTGGHSFWLDDVRLHGLVLDDLLK